MATLLRDGLIHEKWTPLIVVIDVFKDTKSHPLVYGWLVVIVHLPPTFPDTYINRMLVIIPEQE
jgi:hypothetical protein